MKFVECVSLFLTLEAVAWQKKHNDEECEMQLKTLEKQEWLDTYIFWVGVTEFHCSKLLMQYATHQILH